MINKVLICGVRRANQLVSIGQIKQSIGRAGRSYTESGEAIILCNYKDEQYAKSCLYDETPPITSELNNIETIAFHILPWIDMIYDEESFQKWFHKSLAYIQGTQIYWKDISKYLLDTNCINEEYELTDFGKISTRMYYSPARLIIMKNKLLEAAANDNIIDPITISYILSSDYIPIADANGYELSEYKSNVACNGYRFDNGELIHAYAYYCILTGISPKWIKSLILQLKEDLARLFNTLILLAEYENLKDIIDDLNIMMITALKKVNIETAKIIYEFHLDKKTSAYELKELDIITKQDLKKKEQFLINNASESLKQDLQNQGFLKDILIKEWKELNKE